MTIPELILESRSSLSGGFADPVTDSQRVFRAVLGVLSQPGSVRPLQGTPRLIGCWKRTTLALCLTLIDFETPVWVQPAHEAAGPDPLAAWLRFHCNCPLVDRPDAARFALIHDAAHMPALSQFEAGSNEYPDRSATLIIQVPDLESGTGAVLQGPGIRDTALMPLDGLPQSFRSEWRDNQALFPRGVDIILAAPHCIGALPRTTRIKD